MSEARARLDPGAEEFWPSGCAVPQTHHHQDQFALVQPPIYYPYPSPGMQVVGVAPPPCLQVAAPAFCAGATRAVLLSSVPGHVTEGAVRREMEEFGGVRWVQVVERKRGAAGEAELAVVVHFYDLRDAQQAVVEVQGQHMRQQSRLGQHYSLLMRNWGGGSTEELVGVPPLPVPMLPVRGLVDGRAVWAQFSKQPAEGPDAHNQGTIVVFHIDPEVPSDHITEMFQVFGAVKEVREAPSRRPHRFIEFFDVRDAAQALAKMNGKFLYGKRLLIEFSRAGGHLKRLATTTPCTASSSSSAFHPGHKSNQPHTPPGSSRRVRSEAERSSKKDGGERAASVPFKQNHKSSSKNSKRKPDFNYLFKEEFDDGESRTTVMIKNIPNKYSQKLMLNMLDNHCIHFNEQIAGGEGGDQPMSAYDFVYLPIDFNNKCNVGYGFVNLTSPQAAWRLYKAFHKQPWEVFNSRKICEVSYARLQGLEALSEHFKNSKFACDTDDYLPVVFSPPRDGKQLTEPVAVGGHQVGEAAAGRKKMLMRDGEDGGGEGESSSTSNCCLEEDDDEDEEEGGGRVGGGEEEEDIMYRVAEVAVATAGAAATNGCLYSSEVAGLSASTAPPEAFSF